MSDSRRFPPRRPRAWPHTARAAAAIIATACLALLAAGCAGSPPAPGTRGGPMTTTGRSSAGGAPAVATGLLAFSACVRTHGVPNFPDPDGSGSLPASAKQIAHSNPRFQAAQEACRALLPNGALPPGGQPTQAELTTMEGDAREFAQCMRAHGVPSWPDYTLRGGIPIFDLHHTSIDPNSPRIVAQQVSCRSMLHLSYAPPTSGGA